MAKRSLSPFTGGNKYPQNILLSPLPKEARTAGLFLKAEVQALKLGHRLGTFTSVNSFKHLFTATCTRCHAHLFVNVQDFWADGLALEESCSDRDWGLA